jgi:demethylmenaquinone methyltransferase / 2-methoxy-6-polyprenyl-1,4-benzoquinol methylase
VGFTAKPLQPFHQPSKYTFCRLSPCAHLPLLRHESNMSNGRLLVLIVAVPVVAFLVQHILFAGVVAPPTDHGRGSMFDMIATRYDFINRVLAVGMDVGWRKAMARKIADRVSNVHRPRILDIATGTADVSLLLASTIPTATILGVDPSANMLSVGRDKIQARHLESQITLEIADAQQLVNLRSSSFDAATMAFGIRNVPDRTKALCEIHRVLRGDAVFCILEFSEPDDSFGILGRAARLFIRHVVPFLGGVLSGAPREYWHLQNSISDFPSPSAFAALIEAQACSSGHFGVEEVVQMNFGSVQLYVLKAYKQGAGLDESEKEAREDAFEYTEGTASTQEL